MEVQVAVEYGTEPNINYSSGFTAGNVNRWRQK